MKITHSSNWTQDQDGLESLSLQPSLNLSDGPATDGSITVFKSPSFTLKLETATTSGNEAAWIEIDCELPSLSTIVSQVAIQTNARFVELYVDSNYFITLKGTCQESTDGEIPLFTHELHQRFIYSKLRLKFISIKTNKLFMESNMTKRTQLHLAHLSISIIRQPVGQWEVDPPPSVGSILNESLRTANNFSIGELNGGISGLNPAHLLSMMQQKKMSQIGPLRCNTTSHEEQHVRAAEIPAQQQNSLSEMAKLKSVLMSDIAHLIDIKLAPLFSRMDLIQKSIEELIVAKTAAEQYRVVTRDAVVVESIGIPDISLHDAETTAYTIALKPTATSNKRDSISEDSSTALGDEQRSEQGSDAEIQKEKTSVSAIERQSQGEHKSPSDDISQHSSTVSEAHEKSTEITPDAEAIGDGICQIQESPAVGRLVKDSPAAQDTTFTAAERIERGQIFDSMADSAAISDADALKCDMRDLMRLLRGSHVQL